MPTRRTYGNIYQDGRIRIQNNTPVNNFNSQGVTKGFLDILGLELEKIYGNLDLIYRAIDPTRAQGRDLDKLAFLVGEQRTSAIVASDTTETNFHFYIDKKLDWSAKQMINELYSAQEINTLESLGYVFKAADGSPQRLIIPAGTRIYNSDRSISYQTISSVNLENKTDGYVGVTAIGTGPTSNVDTNVLVGHALTEVPELRRISRYIKCTNRFPIRNGKYSQTDDELRYQIATSRNAIQSNELAIRRVALTVPGVRDILFEKNKYGSGTVNLVVEGISPLVSEGLITAVRQVVQTNASYGDVIFVGRPKYLGVEINFSIRTDPTATDVLTIRNNAKNVVIQYINNLAIGAEIIWNEIIAAILDVDGVMDFIPNYFKYGNYDIFHKINKEQIVLRFVNQRARYNEKWYTDTGLVSCCIA